MIHVIVFRSCFFFFDFGAGTTLEMEAPCFAAFSFFHRDGVSDDDSIVHEIRPVNDSYLLLRELRKYFIASPLSW